VIVTVQQRFRGPANVVGEFTKQVFYAFETFSAARRQLGSHHVAIAPAAWEACAEDLWCVVQV
jgi:hypothetical protein